MDELKQGWHEECGLFGIYGPGLDVSKLTYYGLYALQHRGQESAGIAVSDGSLIKLHKGMGLVAEVFNEDSIKKLDGEVAIGHVRYTTAGNSSLINAQPLLFHWGKGMIALAHNGNLTNAAELRRQMYSSGAVFQTESDSEVIVNLIARSGNGHNSLEEAVSRCLNDLVGAYTLLIMVADKLVGVRDCHGVRPLCIGRLGDAYILASESCALDIVGAEFVRDVAPGEIVVIDKNGLTSLQPRKQRELAGCAFEYIYFARPDSNIDGINVTEARREMGRMLARENKVDADVVISVPDSGTAAALGYAQESGLPFEEGLMKNRYIGRTFIQPLQKMRDIGVKLKLNPMPRVLQGKRVIMVDDSIVRGTTSSIIVQMLRDAGAKEVHMMVSSPPIYYPCYYGIDTSGRSELIAACRNQEEIREYIGADSLHYLSLPGLIKALGNLENRFCTACFSGKYPIPIPAEAEENEPIREKK